MTRSLIAGLLIIGLVAGGHATPKRLRTDKVDDCSADAKAKADIKALEFEVGALTNVLSRAAVDAAFNNPAQRQIIYALAGISQITADKVAGKQKQTFDELTGSPRRTSNKEAL